MEKWPTKLKWTRRGNGYYESVSVGGTPLLIRNEDNRGWRLYAGDRVSERGAYRTLIDAKLAADRLFA